MKKDYAFIAILDFAEDGININITFLDIAEAISCAKDVQEAVRNAQEVLQLCLESRIRDGELIPVATDIKDVKLEKNQRAVNISISVL